MRQFLSSFFHHFIPILKNKYILILVVFAVYYVFFDEFKLINRMSNFQKIKKLENEISFYKNEIESSKRQIEELHSDEKDLEKFAREKYLMKKENEDIFIIDEE
jgi:cell division protein FtsB